MGQALTGIPTWPLPSRSSQASWGDRQENGQLQSHVVSTKMGADTTGNGGGLPGRGSTELALKGIPLSPPRPPRPSPLATLTMPGPGFRPEGQATGGHCRSTPAEYQPRLGRAGRAAATPFYKVKYDSELHRERELAQDHTKCGLGMRGSGQSGCAGGPAGGWGGPLLTAVGCLFSSWGQCPPQQQ